MNTKLCVGLFVAIALSCASGCGILRNFQEKTFPKAVYVSVRGVSHLRAYVEFAKYSLRGNDQKASFRLGPLIIQLERPCNGSSSRKQMVFSRQLPDHLLNNPPQPTSNLVKLDYQLGDSGTFYTKKIMVFTPWSVSRRLQQFHEELKCNKLDIIDTWFYVVYKSFVPFGFAEIRFQKGSPYSTVKRSKCPPDDSNIEELCDGNSGYSCPNMTFEEKDGFDVRNISMYVVTGKPAAGKNCSFNSARYSQYMGNHRFFMGNNTQSKKMPRTIPVMTKAIKVSNNEQDCDKKYQMQFYVNTAKLNENDLPCPTQSGVMLQKVDMQIYVKTLNGDPDTDMSQVKDGFVAELQSKNLPYVQDSHYIAQYRGHGPMFGRTLEIWVAKPVPQFATICEGTESAGPAKPPKFVPLPPTTAAPETTTDPMTISYY